VNLTDNDILLRLRDLEDSFVERKTESDSADWAKTVVAFANSMPVGYPAILFIGVTNDGVVQGLENPEATQKSLSKRVSHCFPIPYYFTRVMEFEGGRFLAVVVPGSQDRPHFAGSAFVREGSKSIAASEEQFGRLIAQRNSKAYEILKWMGKSICLWSPSTRGGTYHPSTGYRSECRVKDCNQFYVTIEGSQVGGVVSFDFEAFEIGFDHKSERLELRFKAPFS